MKTTTALCCLLLAAPLALAQDISGNRPKQNSPYKTQAEADKHKADMQQLSVCSDLARRRKLKEGSPEWASLMSGCLREKR